MRSIYPWVLAASLLGSTAVFADDEAMVIQVQRMTLETAQKIAQGALDACREKGIQIGVTVVDRDGVPQVVLRDTIAAKITVPISRGKANAAAMFNVASAELGDRANGPIGRTRGLVMSAGGIPVQMSGSLLGAVGVSGAPSGETDHECAQAGIDAVQDDLDMSM